MFISCRGLKMLVEMVQQDYDEQRDLVWCAVDGICRVFDFSVRLLLLSCSLQS